MSKPDEQRILCAIHWCLAKYSKRSRPTPQVTMDRLCALTGYKPGTIKSFAARNPNVLFMRESDGDEVAVNPRYTPQGDKTFGVMHPAGVRRVSPGMPVHESVEVAKRMRVMLAQQHRLKGTT